MKNTESKKENQKNTKSETDNNIKEEKRVEKELYLSANWKLQKGLIESIDFLDKLNTQCRKKKNFIPPQIEVIIAPETTSLLVCSAIKEKDDYQIAAQNCGPMAKGAYTGEISATEIKEGGVKYVIVGHSERRNIFKEDEELIHKKIKTAYTSSLLPIVCCGESLEEHTNNQTEKIVKRQLKTAFREIEIKPEQLPILIAYEPTWAIGTGVTCDPEEANRIAGEIKRIVKKTITSMEIREKDIKVLYGGSINPENISFFLSQENIDGTLVGGASLDIEKFEKMLEETKKEAEKKLKNSVL